MSKKNPAVLWTVNQTLSKTELEQARTNIGMENILTPTESTEKTLTFVASINEDSDGKLYPTTKSVNVDTSYTATSTNPASGKAIKAAIDDLDMAEVTLVDDSTITHKYIKKIKETDGVISVTTDDMDTTPIAGSNKPITSGAVYSENNELKTFYYRTIKANINMDTEYPPATTPYKTILLKHDNTVTGPLTISSYGASLQLPPAYSILMEKVGDKWLYGTRLYLQTMDGATTQRAGDRGLVPAPSAGEANRYLCADGNWSVPNPVIPLKPFGGIKSDNEGLYTEVSQDRLYDYVKYGVTAVHGWRIAQSKVPKEAGDTVTYTAMVTIRNVASVVQHDSSTPREQPDTIYAYLSIQHRGGTSANPSDKKTCMFNALTPANSTWGLYCYNESDSTHYYTDWYIVNNLTGANQGKTAISINLDMISGSGINSPITDNAYFRIYDGWQHSESGLIPWDDTSPNFDNRRTVPYNSTGNVTASDVRQLTEVMQCSNAPFFLGNGVGSRDEGVYVTEEGKLAEVGYRLLAPNGNTYYVGTIHQISVQSKWLNSSDEWWNAQPPTAIRQLCTLMYIAENVVLDSGLIRYHLVSKSMYLQPASDPIVRFEFQSGINVLRIHLIYSDFVYFYKSDVTNYPYWYSYQLVDTSGTYGNSNDTIYLL